MHKHRAGRNARWFAPEGMRELGPSEKVGAEPTAYAKLEGLGKVPFSNIRRPRPLMDLEAPGGREEGREEEVRSLLDMLACWGQTLQTCGVRSAPRGNLTRE